MKAKSIAVLGSILLGLFTVDVDAAPPTLKGEKNVAPHRNSMGRVLRRSPLYSGPDEAYPLTGAAVEAQEPVLILGIGAKNWYRVLRENGNEGWILTSRVERGPVDADEAFELESTLRLKHRIKSYWSMAAGGMAGFRGQDRNYYPLVGGRVYSLYNFAPRGLIGQKVDQFELVMGVGSFLYRGDVNVELPLGLLWILRPPAWNSFMIGPKIGVTFIEEIPTDYKIDAFFETGLHARFFWNDDWGVFTEAMVQMKRNVAFVGVLGLVLRW